MIDRRRLPRAALLSVAIVLGVVAPALAHTPVPRPVPLEAAAAGADGGRPIGQARVPKDAVSSAGFSSDSDALAQVEMGPLEPPPSDSATPVPTPADPLGGLQ